jgi:TPR repeat protein
MYVKWSSHGQNIEQNYKKAKEYAGKACDLGEQM